MKKKDLRPNERDTPAMQKIRKYGWIKRLPILRQKHIKKNHPRGLEVEAGLAIPVNLKVGNYETEAIPLKIMDYFIEKAGTIAITQCGCRLVADCKKHSVDIGCVWMGKAAANITFPTSRSGSQGKFVTKEEARAHVRAALKDGLIPHLGKLRADAVSLNVLDYEDELMNFCLCCSCCCITATMKYVYSPSDYKIVAKRMEGVSFVTDPEKCVGCGLCFKVCIYNGLKMVKGKAFQTDNCMGCGRCEQVCPNGAISIKFDDDKDIDDVIEGIINRYESLVDISG